MRTRSGAPCCASNRPAENRERVSFDDLPVPAFTGVRTVQPDLATLRRMIDWQFFFLAWELKGKYPAILAQPAARELFDDANVLLDQVIADGRFRARGAYGFWPARSEGDDILIDLGRDSLPLPMLRQQTAKPAAGPTAASPTT